MLTHLSPKYDAMDNPETDFGLEEAAMKQFKKELTLELTFLSDRRTAMETPA